MKIFVSFLQSDKNYPIPAYSFWQHYIKNGIDESGHQWVECPDADWAYGLVPKSSTEHENWKNETWKKTVNWIKENSVDLFISYLYPQQIDAKSIKEIQQMGIPCINFFCDHVREFTSIPSEFKIFDLNWVPEFKAIKMYKKAGYPYINLPMPMWVDPMERVYKEEINNQITFIGSIDNQRIMLLSQLIKANPNLPLAIYGSGWSNNEKEEISNNVIPKNNILKKCINSIEFIKSQGLIPLFRKITEPATYNNEKNSLAPYIKAKPSFAEYNKLSSQSMVTLGINRYPSYRYPFLQPDTYSRLRDIEAPMLGACYLTEYTEGIEELYDIGTEIIVYKSATDLNAQLQKLSSDNEKRIQLKINGQKRALNSHHVGASINKIIQAL
jgi:hypothetical protein